MTSIQPNFMVTATLIKAAEQKSAAPKATVPVKAAEVKAPDFSSSSFISMQSVVYANLEKANVQKHVAHQASVKQTPKFEKAAENSPFKVAFKSTEEKKEVAVKHKDEEKKTGSSLFGNLFAAVGQDDDGSADPDAQKKRHAA